MGFREGSLGPVSEWYEHPPPGREDASLPIDNDTGAHAHENGAEEHGHAGKNGNFADIDWPRPNGQKQNRY
jgi:hypothetical protein